jgi:glycosyltransferase involved in cell wall biosynthesis
MKVLMTADTLGGVWSYALELCSALQTHGVDVALATLGGALSRPQRLDVKRLTNVEVFESDYRLEWMDSPWESLAAAGQWLQSIERQVKPNVVHLNHLVHADLAWRSPVIVVGHSCVFSWWRAVLGDSPGESWDTYRQRVTRSLRCANRVIAPSHSMLRSLCRFYGPLQQTEVIPNTRNPQRYRPAPKEPFIFSSGRLWDDAKNVRALCAIAPALSWPVMIAGPEAGPDGEPRKLDHVTCLGTLSSSAMAEWLGRASLYAAPARYEPFGLGVLEAGLSGCALVLGDIESLREIWEDAALYVTPTSPNDLREALVDLIIHPRALALFGERARARARQFHPREFASAYLNLYRSVCMPGETASCDSYCFTTR